MVGILRGAALGQEHTTKVKIQHDTLRIKNVSILQCLMNLPRLVT